MTLLFRIFTQQFVAGWLGCRVNWKRSKQEHESYVWSGTCWPVNIKAKKGKNNRSDLSRHELLTQSYLQDDYGPLRDAFFVLMVSQFAARLCACSLRPKWNVYENTKAVFFLHRSLHIVSADIFTIGLSPAILRNLCTGIAKTWSYCRKAAYSLGLANYYNEFNIIFLPLSYWVGPQAKSITLHTLRLSSPLCSCSLRSCPVSPFAVSSTEASDALKYSPVPGKIFSIITTSTRTVQSYCNAGLKINKEKIIRKKKKKLIGIKANQAGLPLITFLS